MAVDLYIGAYWKARQESAHQCASRLSRLLVELARCDAVFASWCKKARKRRDATQSQIGIDDVEALSDLLEAGRNRRDIDNRAIDDLGYRVGIWNGEATSKAVSLSVTCGAYSPNAQLGNSVVLDFPEELGDLAKWDHTIQVLSAVAQAWEPDWAGVISRASRERRNFQPGVPFVDWMLYLSNQIYSVPEIQQACSVQPVDDLGTIVVVQTSPIEADNAAHVEAVRAVEEALAIHS